MKIYVMPDDSTLYYYLVISAIVLIISYLLIRGAVKSALKSMDTKFDYLITLYKAELRAKGISEHDVRNLIEIEEEQVDYFKK